MFRFCCLAPLFAADAAEPWKWLNDAWGDKENLFHLRENIPTMLTEKTVPPGYNDIPSRGHNFNVWERDPALFAQQPFHD